MNTLKNIPAIHPKALARVQRNIEARESGCWEWVGGKNHKGYGRVYCGEIASIQMLAHRLVYLLEVGPIPSGTDLHHRETCSKSCVNPEHLTPLAHGDHSVITNVGREHWRPTHCKRGHELPDAVPGEKRQCRICQSALRRLRAAGRPPVALKSHCVRGHEFTPENTRRYMQFGKEQRGCRACGLAATKRYQARVRMAHRDAKLAAASK